MYFSLGIALACLIVDTGHSFAEQTQNGFNVEFMRGATLSDEELDYVANTAYLAGIGVITLIRTAYGPIGMDLKILVREKSTNDGTIHSYRELSVGSEKFSSEEQLAWYRKLDKREDTIIADGFWSLGFETITYFPTDFNGEHVEIKLRLNVNRDDLILIVDALKNGRVEYFSNNTEWVWSSAKSGLPGSIRLGGFNDRMGRPYYTLVYRSGRHSEVLLEGDKLVILSEVQIDN